VKRDTDGPSALGESLRTVVSRFKRVDLLVMSDIRELWPTLVDAPLLPLCTPEFVRDQVLVVRVSSGAVAQRLSWDEQRILEGLRVLGDRAPTSLRPVVKPS